MDIARLNRLHWMAISLLVGVVLAFIWRDQDATLLVNDSSRDMATGTFAQLLSAKDLRGKPILTDLEVHPTMQTALGPANRVSGYKAAMESRSAGFFGFGGGGPGREELPIGEFHVMALRPFKLGTRSWPDVTEYLKSRQQRDPKITFGFSYSSVPAVRMWIIIGASFVLIGGIWPTAVGLMTGQGPWLMPKMGGERYDVGGAAAVPTRSAAETDAEKAAALRQVQTMNESLEKGLGGMAMTTPPGAAAETGPKTAAGAGPAGVRVLKGAEEVPTAVPVKEEEAKEFKGEFYPVAKPIHHEEEGKK